MDTTRLDELVVHAVGGSIYFGTGSGTTRAATYSKKVEDFVKEDWVWQPGVIKILGTMDNVDLLTALYNRRMVTRNKACQIFVGSPSLCSLAQPPDLVIRQMLQLAFPPSLGGWHAMTRHDYQTYALARELLTYNGQMTCVGKKLLKAHPAYKALSFIETLDDLAAAHVIVNMADPRFWMDTDRPDSHAKLKQAFGLGQLGGLTNVRAYLGEAMEPANRYEMAKFALDCWYREGVRRGVSSGPRNFLFRAVCSLGQSHDYPRAVLGAATVFLRFLRATWLDALTPPRRYRMKKRRLGRKKPETVSVITMSRCKTYSMTMFVPHHFFMEPDEVWAWCDHMKA